MTDSLTERFDVIQGALEALRNVCDNVGFVFSPESSTRTFVVRMAFDTPSYFEAFTAKQLGVDTQRPIIVQLEVSLSCLLFPLLFLFFFLLLL